MATSRHWAQQQAQQGQLVEELVTLVGGLEPGTTNYKRAVKFSLANLADSQFPYPAPTQVRARYKMELDKLEVNSQLSKHAALAGVLKRLQAQYSVIGGDCDKEEKLYGKLALLLHLSAGVLQHTLASDRQVAVHKRHAAASVTLDDKADVYAQQLRELTREWDECTLPACNDAGCDDNLSDWSSETDGDAEVEHEGENVDPTHGDQGAEHRQEDPRNRLGEDQMVQDACARQQMPVPSLHERTMQAGGHGVAAVGYTLPLAPRGEIDLQNPCHLAMACAQQEEHGDAGTPRLWRARHLVAHEQTVVAEVLALMRGFEGRLFAKSIHRDHSTTAGSFHNGHIASDSLGQQEGAYRADWKTYGGVGRVQFTLRERIALLHLSPQVS